MLLLDTDHVSILQQQSQPAYDILRARLLSHPPAEIYLSIVSFQEQVQGWLAYRNKARSLAQVGLTYAELESLLRYDASARLCAFDQAAQERFSDLKRQKIRIGTLDLRIAAIALATGATLLSRNLRDFRQVAGLSVEDWTQQGPTLPSTEPMQAT
jgi:tRNA(fMet)-specific endonuclease VapC